VFPAIRSAADRQKAPEFSRKPPAKHTEPADLSKPDKADRSLTARADSAFCNCLHHVQIVCLSRNATGTTHFTRDVSYWSRGGLGAHHAEIDFAEQLITDHGLSFADRA
jgi:hypothetical protein